MSTSRIMPSSIPGQNTHRVVLLTPDKAPTEYERLEETIADALGKGREALRLLADMPGGYASATRGEEQSLRGHIEQRRLLSERARIDLSLYLRALRRWREQSGSSDGTVERIETLLAGVLATSERVADLLAAERDVEWHRARRQERD